MENDNIIIIVKCAGCGLKHSIRRSEVIECELYLCGIGTCNNNAEYILPEKKLLKTSIVFAAAGPMYGVNYLMPSKMDLQFEAKKHQKDQLLDLEKIQNSKLN